MRGSEGVREGRKPNSTHRLVDKNWIMMHSEGFL